MKRSILIRTDASADIGTGHLMRCLALAQECRKKGHEPVFVLSMETSLMERLKNERMEILFIDAERGSIEDAKATIEIARKHSPDWIITDGYAFDATYGRMLRDAGYKVLMIDDYAHLLSYDCDLLLNQNIDATEAMYAGKSDAQLLLGPRFALLRKEFLEHIDQTREIGGTATNVLVTLGGGDPENATALIMDALGEIKDPALSVNIIVGGENPHEEELKRRAASSRHKIFLRTNVTDMPSLMAEADLAIAAAGSTSWELLYMGLPFLTGILAENQAGIAEELGKRKLALNIGWYKDIASESLAGKILDLIQDQDRRKQMSGSGKETVDGRGAERVVEAMPRDA